MTQSETETTTDEQESLAESMYVKAVLGAMCAGALGVIIGYEAAAVGVTKLYAVTVVVLLLFLFYGIVEAIAAIQNSRT